MFLVAYDPEQGHAVADGAAIAYAERQSALARANIDHSVVVGTETMLTAFRIMVWSGKLNHTKVRFQFGDVLVPIDRMGTLQQFPNGFGSHLDAMLVTLP